ncbi:MAG: RDD family protein [Phycisphaerales bacterium]|jgi:uncharacterized RDD family membrane protein YckC|nr:RDD family protein [Phycisphaerales bacterium]MBT7170555.1 RDD family protein [Phycisphaerales bacterium]
MKRFLFLILLLGVALSPLTADETKPAVAVKAKPAVAVKATPAKAIDTTPAEVKSPTLTQSQPKADAKADAPKAAPKADDAPKVQHPILVATEDTLWLVLPLGENKKEPLAAVYRKQRNEDFQRVASNLEGPILGASVFPNKDNTPGDSLHLFLAGSINNHQLLLPSGDILPQKNYPGTFQAAKGQFLQAGGTVYEFAKGQWTPKKDTVLATPALLKCTRIKDGVTAALFPKEITIHHNDTPVVFESEPVAAKFGKELALAYREKDEWKLILADAITGAVLGTTTVQTINFADSFEAVGSLYNNFFLGIMGLMIVVMFGLKPRPITRMGVSPGPFRIAPIWKRLIAFFIDFFPLVMIASNLFIPKEKAMEFLQQQQAGVEADRLIAIIFPEALYAMIAALSVFFLICVYCEWKWGQTLGKRLMKIRVAADGSLQLNAREVMLRNVMKLLEILAMLHSNWFIRIILIAPPIFTPLHMRLGDMSARTVVVDTQLPPEAGLITPAGEQG